MNLTPNKIYTVILFIAILWASFNTFFGEIIPINNGLGYDGFYRYDYIHAFDDYVNDKDFSAYHFRRIYPGILFYAISHLFKFDITPINFIWFSKLYNLLIYLFIILIFSKLLKILKIISWHKVLALVSFLLSFSMAKWYFYYPTLNDQSAIFFGCLMFLLYLKHKNALLFLSTVIVSFCWPAGLLYGAILFIFPLDHFHKDKVLNSPISIRTAITILAGVVYAFIISEFFADVAAQYQSSSIKSVLLPVLPLSFIFGLIYITMGTKAATIQNPLPSLTEYINWKLLVRVVIVLLYYSIIKYLENEYALVNNNKRSITFIQIISSSVRLPLVNLVAHISFIGPIIYLVIIKLPKIYLEINKIGVAILAIFYFHYILSLGSETRILSIIYPILIIVTVRSLTNEKITPIFVGVFTLISFLISRVWLLINAPLRNGTAYGMENLDMYDWPSQFYFLKSGPWMSDTSYVIQLCAYIVLGFILSLTYYISVQPTCKRKRPL